MKKFFLILLALTMSLCLFACTGEEETEDTVRAVTVRGQVFYVDPVQGTVSDGTDTYRYSITTRSDGYELRIHYPDGSSWWWSEGSTTGYGGWSEDYDPERYVSGSILADAIEEETKPGEERRGGGKWLLALVLAALGVVSVGWPRIPWFLEYGWRFKDAEPSDAALAVNRIVGVAILVVALLLILS